MVVKDFKIDFKLIKNNKFSSKLLLNYGICIGSHKQVLQLTTSSVVFGLRTHIAIINLNMTLIELVKVLKLIEGFGFNRCILYYINSIVSFRQSIFGSFNTYNKHLFFPIKIIIINVLRKFKYLMLNKKLDKSLQLSFKRKTLFLLKAGKSLLRKVFVVSKWRYGFVSNSRSFFLFIDNVLHHKIRLGKMLNKFENKVKTFVDFYPLLPHYGFIGDHRLNYWVSNEFRAARVPSSSVIDTLTTKAVRSMYGIPGNACSIDSSIFFLMLLITYYLIGFYQQIFKFCFIKHFQGFSLLTKNKKNFFKNFKKLNYI